MEQSLIQKIKEGLYLDGLDPKSYSPLSLAYIGDAIYEIVIRTIVMSAGNISITKNQAVWSKLLHKKKCLKRSSHF